MALRGKSLYTPDQRLRRDASIWTPIQGVLAIVQFAVFLVSTALIMRVMLTGEGETVAHISVILKTAILYSIMITGALWERDVFGQPLFAPAFFWEDVVSFIVIAIHTAYLAALVQDWLPSSQLLALALLAYGVYIVNAAQFLLKFRQARLDQASLEAPSVAAAGEAS